MTSDPHDFDSLQKLLKLKRHEVPPPGYFNNFSSRVLNRLESAPEPGWFSQIEERLPWLAGLRSMLSQNPIAASAFALCGLLVLGLSTSHYFDQGPASASEMSMVFMPAGDFNPQRNNNVGQLAWLAQSQGMQPASPGVSPVLATNIPGSLFNPFDLAIQPVSYTLPQ